MWAISAHEYVPNRRRRRRNRDNVICRPARVAQRRNIAPILVGQAAEEDVRGHVKAVQDVGHGGDQEQRPEDGWMVRVVYKYLDCCR